VSVGNAREVSGNVGISLSENILEDISRAIYNRQVKTVPMGRIFRRPTRPRLALDFFHITALQLYARGTHAGYI